MNGQNLETSPGDLRRFAVTQTPFERPSADTDVKNSMCQEKKEEEDLPTLKTALTHRYNDSMTT